MHKLCRFVAPAWADDFAACHCCGVSISLSQLVMPLSEPLGALRPLSWLETEVLGRFTPSLQYHLHHRVLRANDRQVSVSIWTHSRA